jgi:thiazole synthase ThiGH ThiG subunit
METVPLELAGMTEICGAVVGVSDWVEVRVPFRMTGGVEAMDCDSVVPVCDAAELACDGVVLVCSAVVVACDAVGFSDAGTSATGTGVLACGADVVV